MFSQLVLMQLKSSPSLPSTHARHTVEARKHFAESEKQQTLIGLLLGARQGVRYFCIYFIILNPSKSWKGGCFLLHFGVERSEGAHGMLEAGLRSESRSPERSPLRVEGRSPCPSCAAPVAKEGPPPHPTPPFPRLA